MTSQLQSKSSILVETEEMYYKLIPDIPSNVLGHTKTLDLKIFVLQMNTSKWIPADFLNWVCRTFASPVTFPNSCMYQEGFTATQMDWMQLGWVATWACCHQDTDYHKWKFLGLPENCRKDTFVCKLITQGTCTCIAVCGLLSSVRFCVCNCHVISSWCSISSLGTVHMMKKLSEILLWKILSTPLKMYWEKNKNVNCGVPLLSCVTHITLNHNITQGTRPAVEFDMSLGWWFNQTESLQTTELQDHRVIFLNLG